MNKLDALIDQCKSAESGGTLALCALDTEAIRRILEAVREDVANANGSCVVCTSYGCDRCPKQWHAATRAALEAMK